ncbi:MerR family transcriptional regulator [Streptomyces radiopugnans]|uniref:DNA-binding transcriptional regulator, MerR family n=1 Tax=Streptomyces radiopugnans TaxID=403935 RepID=A0A1H9J7Q7_9ACTN|nr:MerR family transcriptional regulator [Streptomyces radiopugnans]SEQ82807.1 DNA-binding transcriptional regulator, MerR family [Streptomyces radiopugnans]
MQIGEPAERTGASRRSIRYYEQKGLLRAHRTAKGWREYDEGAVNRVLNVRGLLASGLTVEDILRVEPCLSMEMADFTSCSDADHAISMYEERLAVIDEKAALLRRHREELVRRIALVPVAATALMTSSFLLTPVRCPGSGPGTAANPSPPEPEPSHLGGPRLPNASSAGTRHPGGITFTR